MRLAKSYFGTEVNSELGEGCSRLAVVLENEMVVKIPKIGAVYESAGEVDRRAYRFLLGYDMKLWGKLSQYELKGYELPASCKNIVTEYLFSKYLIEDAPEYAKKFALCKEIKVTVTKGMKIRVIGLYENGADKRNNYQTDGYVGHFLIRDLHDGNFVGNTCVDYACMYLR